MCHLLEFIGRLIDNMTNSNDASDFLFPPDELEDEVALSSIDYWRLCDELNIIQAALLIVGSDPSGNQLYVEGWQPHEQPDGYAGAKAAVSRALHRGDIEGKPRELPDHDINGHFVGPIEGTTDLEASMMEVDSLKRWLRERGFNTGFFFPAAKETPDYLDPNHPRYSQKLAATVNAWLELEGSDLGVRTAKQSLERWLREHAPSYGLSDEDGKPNEKGIEECAKVANWKQKGGAPKTPG